MNNSNNNNSNNNSNNSKTDQINVKRKSVSEIVYGTWYLVPGTWSIVMPCLLIYHCNNEQ